MLSKRITFYVPSTKNVGTPLSKAEQNRLIERVESVFAHAFGGCTSVPGCGSFVTDDNTLIRERVVLVTSYHNKSTNEALAIVIPLAQAIKSEFGQEAIAIETEIGIDFI